MGKEKTTEILRKHFKSLYDYAGMEWTSDNDRDLEQFVNELEEIIEEKANPMQE